MKENLLKDYNLATEDQLTRGLNWFEDQRHLIKDYSEGYNLPEIQVAGALAALSPMMPWHFVLYGLEKLLEDFSTGSIKGSYHVYGNHSDKAKQMITNPMCAYKWLRDGKVNKTWCFFNNLLGIDDVVTVDRHIVASWNGLDNSTSITLNTKEYQTIAQDVIGLAQEKDLLGYQIQAIIWLVRTEKE